MHGITSKQVVDEARVGHDEVHGPDPDAAWMGLAGMAPKADGCLWPRDCGPVIDHVCIAVTKQQQPVMLLELGEIINEASRIQAAAQPCLPP